jgi:hypothetical protein
VKLLHGLVELSVLLGGRRSVVGAMSVLLARRRPVVGAVKPLHELVNLTAIPGGPRSRGNCKSDAGAKYGETTLENSMHGRLLSLEVSVFARDQPPAGDSDSARRDALKRRRDAPILLFYTAIAPNR